MDIHPDDLTHPDVQALLAAHVADMYRISPPGSVHVLDLDGLRQPGVSFWSLWIDGALAGCGALKELDPTHGELKSMRTAEAFRGHGVGKAMLTYLLAEAQRRGYTRVSLETGSQPFFAPAWALYRSAGFTDGPPFDHYVDDPHSVFMTKELGAHSGGV
ncbi:MAG TPA: GNAT family N-acetyltransferase [Holophagaceae bacterium]|nr:GNAT family N-acetyltransferase [Holophagaceae bacterium]